MLLINYTKKVKLIFAFILLFVFAFFFIFLNLPANPPDENINLALKSLSEAKKSRAQLYANEYFHASEKLYKNAMLQWKIQNEKFILNRNYFMVELCSQFSTHLAIEAKKTADIRSRDLKDYLQVAIKEMNSELNDFGNFFNKLPVSASIRKEFSHAILFLSESEIAYNKHEYTISRKKLDEASDSYSIAYEYTNSILSDYFENYDRWLGQAEKIIHKSKKNKSFVVIIDKFSHQCTLYYKGKIKKSYKVELGRNWIGDKIRSGDKATPEGEYKITDKKTGSGTKYHKALLINYPSSEDQKRFAANMKKGLIEKTDKIGGSIEIHGGGGKGVDWTDGCVAMTNSEVDHFYRLVPVGTAVLIVGSLKTLDNYYNF